MEEDNLITRTPEQHLLESGVVNDETIKLAVTNFHNCYKDICQVMKFYLDMPEENIKLIALWILGTYVHKEFNSYPFLFINAMRGSGKSRLLNLISSLSWKGKLTNNITESVLFRTAKNHTIVIDEIESIMKKDKSPLRELLNSAYKKGSSVERMKKVKHKEGEDLIVERFELYCPIAMANISGMEEVLGDRCIPFILEKSSDKSKVRLIEDFESNPIIQAIKLTLEVNQCIVCNVVMSKNIKKDWNLYISHKYNHYIITYTTLNTLTTQNTLEDGNLSILEKIDNLGIDGRNLELIFPLITLASVLDEKLFDEILGIAKTIITQKKNFEVSDSPDIALYEFVAQKDPLTWYSPTDLLAEFKFFFVSDDNDREWLNVKWLGLALRRLKLVVSSKRKSRGKEILLDISKALDKCKIFKTEEKNE